VSIDADPFVVAPAALIEPSLDDPCAPPGAVAGLADGTYHLSAAVFRGGSQIPDVAFETDVQVNGDTEYEIDGSRLSGFPFGDVNCDHAVNEVDGLALLKYTAGLPANTEGCPAIGE
jgi:hypothetical protein